MGTLPSEVQPGDTISSELMTTILSRLSELSDVVLTGTQSVPDVIGKTLADARTLIQQPSRQLALGFVVDVTGEAISPNAEGNSDLVVLNQSPIAGRLTVVHSSVNLVVSKKAGSSPIPNPGVQPEITGTETLNGDSETNFSVGDTMVLVGKKFSANVAENVVTFNAVEASVVSSDPTNPRNRLHVQVPFGIPGAPTAPGEERGLDVVVALTRSDSGLQATFQVDITAPVENAPTITSVDPYPAREGEKITIHGTNLNSVEKVLIKYREVVKEVLNVKSEDKKIDATVPDFGIPQGGIPECTLTVKSGEVSVTKNVRIQSAV